MIFDSSRVCNGDAVPVSIIQFRINEGNSDTANKEVSKRMRYLEAVALLELEPSLDVVGVGGHCSGDDDVFLDRRLPVEITSPAVCRRVRPSSLPTDDSSAASRRRSRRSIHDDRSCH